MEIDKRLEYIAGSLYLASKAIHETRALLNCFSDKSRLNIVKSDTFSFYSTTLQYCIVNEFCKLAQKVAKGRPEQNVSSIDALMFFHHKELKEIEGFEYGLWRKKVDEFMDSDVSGEFRELRDGKFSHIDFSSAPMSISGFAESKLMEVVEALEMPRLLYNSLSKTDLLIDQNVVTNTYNFISDLSRNREFYFTNFKHAKETGF